MVAIDDVTIESLRVNRRARWRGIIMGQSMLTSVGRYNNNRKQIMIVCNRNCSELFLLNTQRWIKWASVKHIIMIFYRLVHLFICLIMIISSETSSSPSRYVVNIDTNTHNTMLVFMCLARDFSSVRINFKSFTSFSIKNESNVQKITVFY